MSAEMLAKAIRQETAKSKLLEALAEAVTRILRDQGDEWNDKPYREADRIDDLRRELEEASKA